MAHSSDWDGKVRHNYFVGTIRFEHPEFRLVMQNHELPNFTRNGLYESMPTDGLLLNISKELGSAVPVKRGGVQCTNATFLRK